MNKIKPLHFTKREVLVCRTPKLKHNFIMFNSNFSPIFIVGYPRSGTTLLAALLNRHSEVAIPPETSFFLHPFQSDLKLSLKQGHLEENGFIQRVVLRPMSLDPDLIWKTFLSQQPCPNTKLLELILCEYTKQRGKIRQGEKSPWHISFVPHLLKMSETAKVICVVRDGRDAVLSIEKTNFGKAKSQDVHCFDWVRCASMCSKWDSKFDRFRWIRYEDLLMQPRETLRYLCNFLELSFEENQLDPALHSNVYREHEHHIKKATSDLDQSRVYAWKRETDFETINQMTKIMSPQLAMFKYSVVEGLEASKLGVAPVYIKRSLKYLAYMRTRIFDRVNMIVRTGRFRIFIK